MPIAVWFYYDFFKSIPFQIVLIEPLTAEQLDQAASPTLTADSPISVSSDDSDERIPKKKHRRSDIIRDEQGI